MADPRARKASQRPVLIIMMLVLLWSAALAVGFGWSAVAGNLSPGRTSVFCIFSLFMVLLAGRTAYELWRRLTNR